MLRQRPGPPISRTQALLFGLGLAATIVPMVVPLIPGRQTLAVGDRAPRTLEAAHSAQYESSALTEAARDDAARTVADVPLPVNPGIRQQQSERLDRLMDAVRTIRQTTSSAQQQLTDLGNIPAAAAISTAGRSSMLALDRTTFDTLQTRAQRALTDIFQKPIQQNEILARIDEYLGQPGNTPPSALELTALREMLRVFVVPNFEVDVAATQKRRDDARANVAPVVVSYTSGQVIVAEGQELREADLEALRATGVINDAYGWDRLAAGALVAIGVGLLLGLAAYQIQPYAGTSSSRIMAILVVTSGLLLLAVRLLIPEAVPDHQQHFIQFSFPVAAVAMVAAAFAGFEFAAVLAMALGVATAFIDAAYPDLAGASFIGSLEALEIVMVYSAAGITGAFAVSRVDRLARFAVAAPLITLSCIVPMTVFWLLGEPRSNDSLAWIGLAAAINGFGSAALAALIFLPVARLAGVTTRLQVAHFADERHPLLRRLEEEAPGTYHHSLMVGTIAERAAERIGADRILAKVGAYYHDIGKLAKPGYYIENMIDDVPNPHDTLAPDQSALAIRDHVARGLEIAARYRLPACVRDFIPQHHGTRMVSFFYRRAGSPELAEMREPFQYAGPRPRTREAAIVMVADACEAIVRARQVGDAASIDAFVDGVVDERLREGQFVDCEITIRELATVADSIKSTLRAVHHPRIAYPDDPADAIVRLTATAREN